MLYSLKRNVCLNVIVTTSAAIKRMNCFPLVHVKDRVPILQPRKVTYQTPCSGWDRIYTGQTSRHLGTRLKEHRSSVRWHDPKSCLALHCMDSRILGPTNSKRAREAIEALHSGEHCKQLYHLQVTAGIALIDLFHPFSLLFQPPPPPLLISTDP